MSTTEIVEEGEAVIDDNDDGQNIIPLSDITRLDFVKIGLEDTDNIEINNNTISDNKKSEKKRFKNEDEDEDEEEEEDEKEKMKIVLHLQAMGLRFINGISSSYDDEYPLELENILNEEDFNKAIKNVNNAILSYWPCNTCFCFGYVCSLCTLGLSFGCPNLCISTAEEYAQQEIERLNCSRKFREINMKWTLVKTCFNSFIKIEIYPN